MPAQYVKPFLKGHKNDYRDAEAIAEAVQRPTMNSVAIKTPEQMDLLALVFGGFGSATAPGTFCRARKCGLASLLAASAVLGICEWHVICEQVCSPVGALCAWPSPGLMLLLLPSN